MVLTSISALVLHVVHLRLRREGSFQRLPRARDAHVKKAAPFLRRLKVRAKTGREIEAKSRHVPFTVIYVDIFCIFPGVGSN